MTINFRKIISALLIFVIALVTGVSVGKIYIDNLEVPTVVGATEEDLREKESVVKEWEEASRGKSPAVFTALQAYLIAEYKLNQSTEFYKVMTGMVYATAGVKQQMKGERLRKNDMYYYNKLSPSTSNLAPAICSRVVYDAKDENNIQVYPTGNFVSTYPDIVGSFDKQNMQIYTMEKFKETFNTAPSTVMPYIISSITCAEAKTTPPTRNSDGNYTFSFSLSGACLTLAGSCYASEIKFSSGMGSLPKWVSLDMIVTIDEDFNFVQIEYDETYKMNAPFIGWTPVNDKFVDKFYFPHRDAGKIPSEEEFLGEVA